MHRSNVRAPGDRPFADPEGLFGFNCEDYLENLDETARHYYAMVENVDDNMGRLHEALERTGRLEDTYVFFFADHGEMLGSQHLMGKCVPFEESVNIPLIATGPDVPAAAVRSAPTCTEDFYPTTCGLAGITPSNELPGIDLSAYLRDATRKPARRFVLLGNDMPKRSWRALRSERLTFAALKDQPLLLFDLEKDPYQIRNLVDDPSCAELLRDLAHTLERRVVETEDFFEFDADRALASPSTEAAGPVKP